ncbi:hypothetical protein Tcan_11404 [Toxocara canis]|uniref:Uncharacterized protein n=1 Tax=Toxocara canis TaxID=6265 RepID=A0A0B2VME5_TOXCA|nr:hypothetical protein Tcan_11404 [Toxocara canis]
MIVLRVRSPILCIFMLLVTNSAAVILVERFPAVTEKDSNAFAVPNLRKLRNMLLAEEGGFGMKRNLGRSLRNLMPATRAADSAYLSFMLPARHGNVRQFHRLKYLGNVSP